MRVSTIENSGKTCPSFFPLPGWGALQQSCALPFRLPANAHHAGVLLLLTAVETTLATLPVVKADANKGADVIYHLRSMDRRQPQSAPDVPIHWSAAASRYDLLAGR